MNYVIVLSGPKSAESQARNALGAAGITVLPTEQAHGLPEQAHGKTRVRQAVGFITCEHEDVDHVARAVASLGYALRLHHEKAEPPATKSLGEVLAEISGRLDALEGAK